MVTRRPSETPRGGRWLRNFPESERTDAAVLLDSIQMFGRAVMRLELTSLISQLGADARVDTPALLIPVIGANDIDERAIAAAARKKGIDPVDLIGDPAFSDRRRRREWVAYDDFMPSDPVTWTRGSESFIGSTLRDLVGERPGGGRVGWIHPDADLDDLRAQRCRTIVLCTDYSGSGEQVVNYAEMLARNPTIRSWRSFGWVQIKVASFASSVEADARFDDSRAIDDYFWCVRAESFSTAQWDDAQRARIHDLCARFGGRSGRNRRQIGYKGSAGLFATDFQAPNNLPAILRRMDVGWSPFFEGNRVPEDIASLAFGYTPERDLHRVALGLKEKRLAQAMKLAGRRSATNRLIVVLALVGAGGATVASIAESTGASVVSTRRELDALRGVGLVTEGLELTEAGMREVRIARRRKRVVTAGLSGSAEDYYPSSLR